MSPSATRLKLDIHAQPDDITCGPTCLHVLNFIEEKIALQIVILWIKGVERI